MKRYLSFPLLLCASVFSVHAQLNPAWINTYGGMNNEELNETIQCLSGGFISVGFTEGSSGWSADLWLVKTDSDGDTLWTKTYGGISTDYGTSIKQTPDGGYIVSGYTFSFGQGSSDAWLIKTDANGDSIWAKTYGGWKADGATAVELTSDGGYAFFGYTESFGEGNTDFWLVKTDSLGDTLWTNSYGSIYPDIAFSGHETSDGGFIMTGYTQKSGFFDSDIWLIKTDENGDTVWTSTFGGNLDELASSVQQTADSGYIITGYTESYGAGLFDVWLIKTDSKGDSLWSRTFGGSSRDEGQSVIQTSDGGFLVCGYAHSFSATANADLWLIKTDSQGDSIWTMLFDRGNNDVGFSISPVSDGGYIAAGFSESAGTFDKDALMIRLLADGQTANDDSGMQAPGFSLQQNYPNPFFSSTKINFSLATPERVKIVIYDVRGSLIETLLDADMPSGSSVISFDAGNFPAGLYFYKISCGSYSASKKMILLH